MRYAMFLNNFLLIVIFVFSANGSDNFTAAIYKAISEKSGNENTLFSPFELGLTLNLLKDGAGGTTYEELTSEPFKKNFVTLRSKLNKDFSILTSAMRLYVDKKIRLQKSFKHIAEDVYNTEIERMDFSKPVKTARKINSWESGRTYLKINHTVEPTDFEDRRALIIINVMNLNAKWGKVLLPREPIMFKNFGHASETTGVGAIGNKLVTGYFEDHKLGTKFLELPFEDNGISAKGKKLKMIIALPNAPDGLEKLERKIESVISPKAFRDKTVDFRMPQIALNIQNRFKSALEHLGLTTIFNSNTANFTGISNNRKLFISDLFSNVIINIDETGANIGLNNVSVLKRSQKINIKEFIVDHPFIYYFKRNGQILFIGRVTQL